MYYDFNKCPDSFRHYDGNAGPKQGIILNGEPWFVKFPQSTKGNRTRELSYTTSPLSEYIGSHIYSLIGLPVHETVLGVHSGKIVVACKDFRVDGEELLEFSKIKNSYFPNMEEILGEFTGSGSSTDLNEIKLVMENNNVFLNNSVAKERFWDMFVVDALIGNRDRNNGNWGFIKRKDGSLELAPVYDNGNSFANKAGDEKMQKQVNDVNLMKHSALTTGVCVFKSNDKPINPYLYILNSEDEDLNNALRRIVPRIDINKINAFIDDIPYACNDLVIMSDVRREYYKQLISLRYNEVLKPAYEKVVGELMRNISENNISVDEIIVNASNRCDKNAVNCDLSSKELC